MVTTKHMKTTSSRPHSLKGTKLIKLWILLLKLLSLSQCRGLAVFNHRIGMRRIKNACRLWEMAGPGQRNSLYLITSTIRWTMVRRQRLRRSIWTIAILSQMVVMVFKVQVKRRRRSSCHSIMVQTRSISWRESDHHPWQLAITS